MANTRTLQNRIKAWTGTVHYAKTTGHTVCGARNTSYSRFTLEDVTCQRCTEIAGKDEVTGYVTPPVDHRDEHARRRDEERAARRAARG